MIKCEVVDNRPVYIGEKAHIVFYKGDNGLRYVVGTPIIIGDVVTEPDEVKVLLTRGYAIVEAYAIEEGDVATLRGIYASTRQK